jgi:hypothetical protein
MKKSDIVSTKNASQNMNLTNKLLDLIINTNWFDKIYQLVKIQGFKLDAAKSHLKPRKKQEVFKESLFDLTPEEIVIDRLERIKTKLLKLK